MFEKDAAAADDESDDDYILQSDKRFHLPKLAVPFKDAERGWNNDVVVDQATLYLNILGYVKVVTKASQTQNSKRQRNQNGGTMIIISKSIPTHPKLK